MVKPRFAHTRLRARHDLPSRNTCYSLDAFNGAYQLLDLTAKGRDEDDLPWTMAWLHRHDGYRGGPTLTR